MDVQVRSVSPARGWAWITGGVALFFKSPVQWLILLAILFAAKKALTAIPVPAFAILFSALAMLLMPVFIAGLMDGCRALETGLPLKVGHLAQGFRRNASHLVTIGGIYLAGNLVILMTILAIGGDAIVAIAKNPTITPQIRGDVREATASMARAVLVGASLSVPLLMAVCFAPLLAYFDDLKPFAALRLSLVACVKNMLPMLVYGLVLLAALMVLVPIGAHLREVDLGLWLLSPVLVPSIYASYRDIFSVSNEDVRPDALQS